MESGGSWVGGGKTKPPGLGPYSEFSAVVPFLSLNLGAATWKAEMCSLCSPIVSQLEFQTAESFLQCFELKKKKNFEQKRSLLLLNIRITVLEGLELKKTPLLGGGWDPLSLQAIPLPQPLQC